MRTISLSNAYRRDYRRVAKGMERAALDAALVPVLTALAEDRSLEPARRDHALTGDWSGYPECHLKPDLLLIYRKLDANALWLVRLGSHTALFD
jgi:mRNA interferase YafQ